jgi:hypothetical protein
MKGFLLSVFTALILLSPAISRGDMTIRNYTPSKHYRFYSGSDKAFIGASYNFSGVGYSSGGGWATLVSNNYFLSATHLHPTVGQTVTFYATNSLTGPSYTYTVTGGTQVGTSDLWVGWFGTAVDTSITRYSILMEPTLNDYKNLVLYNYGKGYRVGRNVIDRLTTVTVGASTGLTAWYDYDNKDVPSVGGDETYLQSGDSGAPSFAIYNNSLALVGIHWAITSNPYYSIDTFVPNYYSQFNTVLTSKGQTAKAVPEPGLLSYAMVSSLCLMYLRRRRNAA